MSFLPSLSEEEIEKITNKFSDLQVCLSSSGLIYSGNLDGLKVSVHRVLEVESNGLECFDEFKILLHHAKNMDHPNILKTIAWSPQPLCIVTEYMESDTVFERLQRNSFSLIDLWQIILDLTSALLYLKEIGSPVFHLNTSQISLGEEKIWKLRYNVGAEDNSLLWFQQMESLKIVLIELLTGLPNSNAKPFCEMLTHLMDEGHILRENLQYSNGNTTIHVLEALVDLVNEMGSHDFSMEGLEKWRLGTALQVKYDDIRLNIDQIKNITNNWTHVMNRGKTHKSFKGRFNGKDVSVVRVFAKKSAPSLETEALLLHALKHPNVMTVIGYELSAPDFVTEYTYGGTLKYWLKESLGRGLNWKERVQISCEMASAVSFMLKSGFLHSELNPNYVFLDEKANSGIRCRIRYMGFAEFQDEFEAAIPIPGIKEYIDPKTLENQRINESSNTYTLGLMILQVLLWKSKIQDIKNLLEIFYHNIKKDYQENLDDSEDCLESSWYSQPGYVQHVDFFLTYFDEKDAETLENFMFPAIKFVLRSVDLNPENRPSVENGLLPALEKLYDHYEKKNKTVWVEQEEGEVDEVAENKLYFLINKINSFLVVSRITACEAHRNCQIRVQKRRKATKGISEVYGNCPLNQALEKDDSVIKAVKKMDDKHGDLITNARSIEEKNYIEASEILSNLKNELQKAKDQVKIKENEAIGNSNVNPERDGGLTKLKDAIELAVKVMEEKTKVVEDQKNAFTLVSELRKRMKKLAEEELASREGLHLLLSQIKNYNSEIFDAKTNTLQNLVSSVNMEVGTPLADLEKKSAKIRCEWLRVVAAVARLQYEVGASEDWRQIMCEESEAADTEADKLADKYNLQKKRYEKIPSGYKHELEQE